MILRRPGNGLACSLRLEMPACSIYMNDTTKMGEGFPQKVLVVGSKRCFNPVNGSARPSIGPVGPGMRGFYIIVELRCGSVWNWNALPCVVQAGRLQRRSGTV